MLSTKSREPELRGTVLKLMKTFVCLFAVLLSASFCLTREIAGIDFPDVHELSEGKLILNGAGVRTKFFINLYVGGLYLEEKNQDPEQIILAESSMAIRLHIISSMITSEKMEKATRKDLRKQQKVISTLLKKRSKISLRFSKKKSGRMIFMI